MNGTDAISEAQHMACQSSLEAGEPLYASATRVDVWLLLEYDGSWGAKALEESDIADSIKGFLAQHLKVIPNSRFQFIKQSQENPSTRAFYFIRSNGESPQVYRFNLTAYDDLLKLDLAALAAGQVQDGLSDERLFLVCVNGKRDMCCARNGVPLYLAMQRSASAAVWQTIHLGGHRFAGTMVCLPDGLYYGRVDPNRAQGIVEAYQQGEIVLDNYRGCSAYDAAEQAADYFLRQEYGLRGIGHLQKVSSEKLGENRWKVVFRNREGQEHEVYIRSELSDFEIYESSRDSEKKHIIQYRRETA